MIFFLCLSLLFLSLLPSPPLSLSLSLSFLLSSGPGQVMNVRVFPYFPLRNTTDTFSALVVWDALSRIDAGGVVDKYSVLVTGDLVSLSIFFLPSSPLSFSHTCTCTCTIYMYMYIYISTCTCTINMYHHHYYSNTM